MNGKSLPKLLDIPSLAEHLGVTDRHIRRLVFEKRIPYIKWGHLVRFDPEAVRAWLDAARIDASAGADGPVRASHFPRHSPRAREW